jgi:hypothetical protein
MRIAASVLAGLSTCLFIATVAAQSTDEIARLPTQTYVAPSAMLGERASSGPATVDINVLAQRSGLRLSGIASDTEFDSNARKFLEDNAAPLGLSATGTQLRLKGTKRSLTGSHVEYEQTVGDLPILESQISVSVGTGGEVTSVVRSVVRVPLTRMDTITRTSRITEEQAYDIAWKDLAARGDLLERPSIGKAYLNENNVLTLVYVVRLAVEEPIGYWEYRIDANTGRIIQRFDRRIQKGLKRDTAIGSEPARARPEGSFEEALARFEAQADNARAAKMTGPADSSVNATAIIFDPNPPTALNDFRLRDNSAARKFSGAYLKTTLPNVTERGGRLFLSGPNVRLEDFEPGEGGLNRPPSSVELEWTARRGNNAFNDVMTYYFLDKAVNYLRSLGFAGERELFPQAITADSDGADGDDNSYYVPGSDRLTFGHGCVDDNEDSDVILHEFGHAITNHINQSWSGGDSGAIGEGFGDYWAYSYRYKSEFRQRGDKGKVFVWDGIASCWPGRRVDNRTGRYSPDRNYGAHEDLGGFQADELWSTPLAQSLIELVGKGETPESVDTVVLQGMFGIGSDFTMRSLARATVEKAKLLYPGKPHAAVFQKHFRANGILE